MPIIGAAKGQAVCHVPCATEFPQPCQGVSALSGGRIACGPCGEFWVIARLGLCREIDQIGFIRAGAIPKNLAQAGGGIVGLKGQNKIPQPAIGHRQSFDQRAVAGQRYFRHMRATIKRGMSGGHRGCRVKNQVERFGMRTHLGGKAKSGRKIQPLGP